MVPVSETSGLFPIPHRSEWPHCPFVPLPVSPLCRLCPALGPPSPWAGEASGVGVTTAIENATHTYTQCRQRQPHHTSRSVSQRAAVASPGWGWLPPPSVHSAWLPLHPYTDNIKRPQKSNQQPVGFWGYLLLLLQKRCSTERLEPQALVRPLPLAISGPHLPPCNRKELLQGGPTGASRLGN